MEKSVCAKHYHFIGIGGIGMSGIAQILLSCGAKVSGSDLKESRITGALKKQGATIYIGHAGKNIKGADVIVYSTAIKEDNPEMVAAKTQGAPLLKRAQALGELMQDKTVITVTGSHGKTTTTSLISYLLLEAGLMPTVAIGGILKNIETNACIGRGEFFVAEADESDGSFLYYHPKYSIITNIDREHLDYYKDFDNELEAFKKFLFQTDKDGCVFACGDDPNLINILKGYKGKVILFGMNENNDVYPKNISLEGLTSEFDCFYKDKLIARFNLALGGEHNISNSLAAIALGLALGIDISLIKKALTQYKGAKRRLEIKYSSDNYLVIDDYAHHPTEIKATLSAAKKLKPKRLVAVFQPHRYTRTQLLLDEFAKSFDAADYVIITDIYPASEPPIQGITGKLVSEVIKKRSPGKEAIFLPKDEIVPHLLKIIQDNDLLITLGAGDIVRLSDELAEELKRKS